MNLTYKRVKQVAMAGAVSLIVGTGADAATVGAVWDPAFGGSFPGSTNLSWFGQAEFSIPDGCLSAANTSSGSIFVLSGTGYFDTNISASATCNMGLNFADVTLYNDPPGQGAGTSVYHFTGQGFSSGNGIDGMLIKDVDPGEGIVNAVIGIQTHTYSFLRVARDGLTGPDPGDVYAGPLWLWFTLGDGFDPANGSTNPICSGEPSHVPCDVPDPTIYNSNPAPLSFLETCTANGCVTVTAVPEPGTMGLLLGGLGAGWFARRRKKTA